MLNCFLFCSLRKYESNLKPLWADDILCSDNASLFSDCRFKEPVGYSNCSGRQILGVDCGKERSDMMVDTFTN